MSSKAWTSADIPDQTGRTVIVTGANSGLGFHITRHLARRGAHVVMAVRNEAKGRAAAAAIGREQPGASLEIRRIDLADLDSVEQFAERYRADGGKLDLLVNNAGVMAPPRTLSAQGHELQFAANHLGHFALTGRLLNRLEQGADPRVVTVSSLAHHPGRIHFDDLDGEHDYTGYRYYGQSKLANALFGIELDRRLRISGSPVRSLLAHPGLAATNLLDNGFNAIVRVLGKVVMPLVAQSAEAGAMPELYAATSPDAEGGQFIGPDGRKQYRGRPTVVRPDPKAEDREAAKRLWTVSEEMTGVRYHLPATA